MSAATELRVLRSNLEKRIASQGVSAREVSERAGLNPGAVTDILASRSKNPGIASLAAIAHALGCEVADLLRREPDESRGAGVAEDNVADAIRAIFVPLGGVELEAASRRSHRRPPDFSAKADDAA